MKHHPTFLRTGAQGAWCTCSCGWESGTRYSHTDSQLAFAEHMSKQARDERRPTA